MIPKIFLVLLLSTLLDLCYNDYGSTVEARTIKKLPISQKLKKSDFESKIKLEQSEQNEPRLIYRTVENSVQSVEGQILFDQKYQTIYLLSFSKDDKGKINDSNLYISRNMGVTIDYINLVYKDKDVMITKIFVSTGIAVAIDDGNQLIATTLDHGRKWNIAKSVYKMQSFMFHPTNTNYVAAKNVVNQLSISLDNGILWKYKNNGVLDYLWSRSSNYIYYTKNSYYDTNYILYREDADVYDSNKLMLKNVIELKSQLDIVYATTKTDGKIVLMISYLDGDFKEATFPSYLKPIKFIVQNTLSDEIFVAVVNETNDVHLYSALITDLKFSRISDDIGKFNQLKQEVCIDLETFNKLPGVLITQKKFSDSLDNYYTAISYSHGNKWGHIIAPTSVDRRECKWPNCYMRLSLECENFGKKRTINFPKNSPNIMVAHGYLVNPPDKEKDALFISTDAGYSWIRALPNLHDYTILNDGNIIITFPEYSHDAFYSYNYGLTWTSINITQENFRALAVFHNDVGDSMISSTIGYNLNTNEWVFLVVDFSHTINNDCNENDYDTFTPGATRKDQCFQGKKNGMYKRRHNVTCKSIVSKLPEIKSSPCPCTVEDFGCSFGYYISDEQCMLDPDMIPLPEHSCKGGEFVITSSTYSKIHGDGCKNTDQLKDEEADICNYTYNKDSFTILAGNTLKYVVPAKDNKIELVKLPIYIGSTDPISSFDIDHKGRCAYYTNSSGIIKTCWGTRDEALGGKETIFLKKANVLGLDFEEFGRNLYYYTASEIVVLEVDGKYQKNLISSATEITYFNVLPQNFYMAYATYVIGKDKQKQYEAIFLNTNGQRVQTSSFPDIIKTISYIPETKTAMVYTDKDRYDFLLDGSAYIKKKLDYPDILEAEVRGDVSIYITKDFIAVNENKILHSHISDGIIYVSSDRNKNPCLTDNCRYFCFPLGVSSYECGCPETMKLENDTTCICDVLHPKCKECKDHEFNCDSGKCIDIVARCNGVDDCGDGSDELNCIYTCSNDEFLCGDNKTCVNIVARCNGVMDCPDGIDEEGCPELSNCTLEEFECANKKCIPFSQYCNGVDDCGDFSDEDSCEEKNCKSFEVKCKNGQCILPIQVCNGVFDCTDWSDEQGCDGTGTNSTDRNCTLKCDDKCIPFEKICDHITDCEDGIDELDCKHSFNCPDPSYKQCINDISCYPYSSDCDGFAYCSDGSDEINCQNQYNTCNLLDNFKCYTQDKCITLNQYCDGVVDCDDKSDEGKNCLNYARVFSLAILEKSHTGIKLSWEYNHKQADPKFNVTIQQWDNPQNTQMYIVSSSSIEINNLIICSQYTVTVKMVGSVLGRSAQFVSKPSIPDTPTELVYSSTGSLTWKMNNVQCLSPIIFVECNAGKIREYKNFTSVNEQPIIFKKEWSCRVAACPMNVFNINCSKFSNTVHLTDYTGSTKFVKVGLPILLVIALLAILIYVGYKLKKSGKLSGICDRFKISKPFQRLPVVANSSEQAQLFNEEENDEAMP